MSRLSASKPVAAMRTKVEIIGGIPSSRDRRRAAVYAQ
jgi:hypothetical protein